MNGPSKRTAVAHPNFALVKYWGKRDERLVLPHQSSVSLTASPLSVKTTVELGAGSEEVALNGREARGPERDRVLQLVRWASEAAGIRPGSIRVRSQGDFPEAAGLASSAAAFAALAVAVRSALGLPREPREESMLARRGSGSASRSVEGGVCVWERGARPDGRDSFARQMFPPEHWPSLRLVVAVLSREKKALSSREAMRLSVQTSPFYAAWVEDAEGMVTELAEAIRNRDLARTGELAELSSSRMHAVALAGRPPTLFFGPKTVEVLSRAREAREAGLPVWVTVDAGPNPVLLTDSAHQEAVAALARSAGALEVVGCELGGGARLVDEHLF